MQLTKEPIISNGGPIASGAATASRQVPLPLEVRTEDVTILCSDEFVRARRKCDAESVFAMVENGLHPRHIRFAFNLALEPAQSRRELRFWTTEILDPESVKKWTIEEVLSAIVGHRETFNRGFVETQWVISASIISRFVKTGELAETGNRFLNATLKNFLRRRWEGNQCQYC